MANPWAHPPVLAEMTEERPMAISASAVYSLGEEDYTGTSQGIAILYRRKHSGKINLVRHSRGDKH